MRANRQIYAEAKDFVYMSRAFEVCIDSTGLYFQNQEYSRYQAGADRLDFAAALTNVRAVHLVVFSTGMVYWPKKTVNQIPTRNGNFTWQLQELGPLEPFIKIDRILTYTEQFAARLQAAEHVEELTIKLRYGRLHKREVKFFLPG